MLDLIKPIYPLFFKLLQQEPESAHRRLLQILTQVDHNRDRHWGNWLEQELTQSFSYEDSRLEQKLWGINFTNPLGLAPGFDKDGVAARMWQSFGFGFAELGAVTLHPQPGNQPPRMFRLPLDKAALNRMGANNQGAQVIASRLAEVNPSIPIGINLCKSKITPLENAAQDYLESFRYFKNCADYFVVNVSSPNTPGLRSLQGEEQLEGIIETLQQENQGQHPILVKISPDLDWNAIASIIALATKHQLAGLVATNTTTEKTGLKTKKLNGNPLLEEAGGISGEPLKERSTAIIRFIWQQTQGKLPIIGVGGIFTPEDAWSKITAGASLLQVYTGWIYQGPWMVKTILQGLVGRLEATGLTHLSEAIGQENL
ncbi:quinone-dependent dihydroorotate dehydrogenase [Gloeocapsa sp. PCC 73106]|uniref:quinone-dependent dihydroorotate dehydrogenase n=1 Tax=Gloeocapsa sp. PCC 73106 TaxID=102232 RepID=UPI0002ACAEF0|nr:quinone-dependent dihydroorotate dehydrogenase [Gloeocapsa sp. PCC 73106]ELR99047.1 dihydroorotate oxidase A [Gloeocapsa sp. PCC 73106]